MKLKKIASLALAGIMAVSMLAGCSTTSVDPEPTPNPGNDEPTVSGYSQMLYNHLTNAAKKKVTPQDSNDVNDALAAAMKYAAGNTIANSYDWFIDGDTHPVNGDWGRFGSVLIPDSLENGAKKLISELGAENNISQNLPQTFNVLDPDRNNYNRDDMNISMLFVADGLKDYDAVMDEVAAMIKRQVEWLEDDYDLPGDILEDNGGHSMNTDYEYIMSVAADTITLTADHGKSMTFVAVNIARV